MKEEIESSKELTNQERCADVAIQVFRQRGAGEEPRAEKGGLSYNLGSLVRDAGRGQQRDLQERGG